MKRTGAVKFKVARGEVITITVTPVSVGSFVAASFDGEPLVDQEPSEKGFQFIIEISEAVGNIETVKVAVQFQGDEKSPNARYEFTVSDGTTEVDLAPIPKPSKGGFVERTRTLQFEVA